MSTSTPVGTAARPLRVAVVGSGPAGVANPAVIVIGDVVRVSPFAPSHFKTADYSTTTPNRPRVLTK